MNQVIASAGYTPLPKTIAPATVSGRLLPLAGVPRAQWELLGTHPVEANGFFDPGFVFSADRNARRGGGTQVLAGFAGADLTAVLPVVSAQRAFGVPVPALVATQPYNSLSTPLLSRHDSVGAAGALLDAARTAGASLLVLPMVALEGPAYEALLRAAADRRLAVRTEGAYERAVLATDLDDETYLRSGLGSKKLKELRRQGHRLADEGAIDFPIASTPADVAAALERFLDLEARGWKGMRGTGLGQHAGDARFVREMAADLSARGAFEIMEMTLDGRTIASGLIMRQRDRALFFKIAYDEGMARLSVGVQLTLALTRRSIADTTLALVDSTASADHPMIDHLWRERLRIGDLYIQTRSGDPIGLLSGQAIRLRHGLRAQAKRLYHRIRTRRETSK